MTPELSRTDILMIVKKLEEDWDVDFKKQHDIVLYLTKDEQETMEDEQSMYDEHDEKVSLLSFCLQELALEEEEAVPKSKPAAEFSHLLGRRLHYIENSIGTISESMDI